MQLEAVEKLHFSSIPVSPAGKYGPRHLHFLITSLYRHACRHSSSEMLLFECSFPKYLFLTWWSATRKNVTIDSEIEGAPFVIRELQQEEDSILCSGINHSDFFSGWRTGSIIYHNLLQAAQENGLKLSIPTLKWMVTPSTVGFCAVKSVLLYAPYHSKTVSLFLGSAPLYIGLKLNKSIQDIRKSNGSIGKAYFKS